MACKTHGPAAAIDQQAWRSGVHLLQCGCSPWRLKRHNKAGADALKVLYRDMGWTWEEKHVACHIDSGKRVDAICKNVMEDFRPDAVDITVGCGACETYVTQAATREANWLTDRLEQKKADKHAQQCARAQLNFVPAAFTTYGGWGQKIRRSTPSSSSSTSSVRSTRRRKAGAAGLPSVGSGTSWSA